MSSSDGAAISVKDLGKRYTLYDRPEDRLKQMLFWRLGRRYGHPFWALKEINFDIRPGETFGVIGKNGSGKSTLLQILAGILDQTTGTSRVDGRVSALLELGSGFNPEFTGRENVFLYGNILGVSQEEMKDRFGYIAAFADIGEFIDQPVKFYSSGMFVRLAFAVAAGVDADVMLIDEALAVGDIFFRQKCYQRLEKLRKKGTTILLVSHAMTEVEQFCERAVLLNEGCLEFLGSGAEAVKRYYLIEQMDRLPAISAGFSAKEEQELSDLPSLPSPEEITWPGPEAFLDISSKTQVSNGWAKFTTLAVCNQNCQPCLNFEQGETASLFYEVEVLNDLEVPIGGFEFINQQGIIVFGKNTLQYEVEVPFYVQKGTRLRYRQDIRLDLMIGEYTFNLGFSTLSKADFQRRASYAHPDLDAKVTVIDIMVNAGYFGVAYRKNGRPIQLLHHGIANLTGSCAVGVINGT